MRMAYFVWREALAAALSLGRVTGVKYRVTRGTAGFWYITPGGAA